MSTPYQWLSLLFCFTLMIVSSRVSPVSVAWQQQLRHARCTITGPKPEEYIRNGIRTACTANSQNMFGVRKWCVVRRYSSSKDSSGDQIKRTRWTGYVARIGHRKCVQGFGGETWREIIRHRWVYNIKMEFQDTRSGKTWTSLIWFRIWAMRDLRLPSPCKWDLRSSAVLTQRRSVVSYRRFGTTSSTAEALKMGPICCPVTVASVRCVTSQNSEDLGLLVP